MLCPLDKIWTKTKLALIVQLRQNNNESKQLSEGKEENIKNFFMYISFYAQLNPSIWNQSSFRSFTYYTFKPMFSYFHENIN